MKKIQGLIFFVIVGFCLAQCVRADESAKLKEQEYKITIKDHVFSPRELKIPANQKIKLIIENQDAAPEEFDSYQLDREEVVAAHKTISVFIGPLNTGKYQYEGEFHSDTAQGVISAE